MLLILVLVAGIGLPLCAQDAAPDGYRGEMVWDGSQWVVPAPPEPGTPDADVAEIRQLVELGQNKPALKKAEQFLLVHPASPLSEEAMNLAGQANLNRGEYWKSFEWYRRQVETYPNGAYYLRAMDRMYTIADDYLNGRKRRVMKILRLSAKDEAVDILTLISGWAPGTTIGEKALLRVGDFYFAEERYEEAVATYDQFVQDSPNSDRRPYAMLQGARASLLSFRGVNWDIAPLNEAEQRFRVFRKAFPRQAKGENIEEILSEIYLTKAHKIYETAKFYDRVHKPRAAKFYYRRLEAEYGDTHWAESARARLELFGEIEPEAPDRLPDAREPDESDTQTATGDPDGPVGPVEQPGQEPMPQSPAELGPTHETGVPLEDLLRQERNP